eukprot:31220-Pelagococcus_subviridis.AAC.5
MTWHIVWSVVERREKGGRKVILEKRRAPRERGRAGTSLAHLAALPRGDVRPQTHRARQVEPVGDPVAHRPDERIPRAGGVHHG